MSNVRDKKSRDRNRGNAATASDVTRSADANGDSVRTNDGNESPVVSGSASGQIGAFASNIDVNQLSGGYSRTEIETGYYFAPNGNIERIPDGYYVDAKDGRLKKRRKRRDTDNAYDGNESYGREQTSDNETEFGTPPVFRKPITTRGRRKQQTVKEETKKLTMITLLASGCSAIFTSVALLTKHEHWQLRNDCSPSESKILAEAINDAINTLPTKYYEQIIAIVEKWIPWINLCFVLSALVFDRIEQSKQIVEQTEKARYVVSNASDNGNAASRTQTSNVGSATSLGYGQ